MMMMIPYRIKRLAKKKRMEKVRRRKEGRAFTVLSGKVESGSLVNCLN